MESVFCFIYTECIYEGAPCTISIHKTRDGAVAAMQQHNQRERAEWEKLFNTNELREDCPFAEFAKWDVIEMSVNA